MIDGLQREFIYLSYYFMVQLRQIFRYWLLGMLIGSAVSVFAKDKIHGIFLGMRKKKMGVLGIIPACLLGIASPLCMYGTIPIAASFLEKGMRDDWLAAFMMASILLNPQLMIYSTALGTTALLVRIVSCVACGLAAGLLVSICYRDKPFFDFSGFRAPESHDTDSNLFLRFWKNFGRNVKATGGYFLFGILLAALFQRYVPAEGFAELFGKNHEGFGILMAATIGVPLYACGGGTIPLLQQWMWDGMSMGSAVAFMVTGPATKITNLGAVKIVLGKGRFALYLVFVMLFAYLCGMVTGGVGYYQEEGKPAQIIRKGDVVECPPGVKHWHGGSADTSFAHIAANTNPEQTGLEWFDRISDEEYSQLPTKKADDPVEEAGQKAAAEAAESNILVAYFSMPETDGTDTVAGAGFPARSRQSRGCSPMQTSLRTAIPFQGMMWEVREPA